MSEYREALDKLLLRIDGLPESHFAVIFEWPQYKSAKALLARPEPEIDISKPLPCPFCGKQPSSQWNASGDDGYYGIDCCNAFAHAGDEESALKEWNRRVEPAAAEKARELFRHKKTGNLYEVHGVLVDCTNSRDGTGAIIYGAVGDPPKYVRDAAEFSEKFEHMPSPPASKVEAEKAREQTKAIDLPGYVKPDNTERVHFYEQEFYVLSNFSAFNVQWNRQIFATSEHAYHWAKFPPLTRDENGTYVRDAILNAPSAHEAFKLAERFKSLRRADWDTVKVEIMHQILRAKADQHEYVRRKLLQTGDRELVEDSWRDPFWGWGPQRDGQNMLGKLWMEIRAELRVLPSPPAATGDAK